MENGKCFAVQMATKNPETNAPKLGMPAFFLPFFSKGGEGLAEKQARLDSGGDLLWWGMHSWIHDAAHPAADRLRSEPQTCSALCKPGAPST